MARVPADIVGSARDGGRLDGQHAGEAHLEALTGAVSGTDADGGCGDTQMMEGQQAEEEKRGRG